MLEDIQARIVRETARKEMDAHQKRLNELTAKRQEIQDEMDKVKTLWRRAAERFETVTPK